MNIRLQVFCNQTAFDNKKAVFERALSIPFGVQVPYQQLIDDMRFLFGENCIVQFRID